MSFIALQFSNSDLIRTFGEAGLIATAIALLAVLMLVPLLGMLLVRNEARFAEKARGSDIGVEWLRRFCRWIATQWSRARASTRRSASLWSPACASSISHLQPRYRLADQLPDRDRPCRRRSRLDAKLTGANPIDVLIQFPKGASLYRSAYSGADRRRPCAWSKSRPASATSGRCETLRAGSRKRPAPHRCRDAQAICRHPAEISDAALHLCRPGCGHRQRARARYRRQPVPAGDQRRSIASSTPCAPNYPGYKIAVTGLSAIAARNSATMIDRLKPGLTVEIVFVAAFIGIAFRSLIRDAGEHSARHFPDRARRRALLALGLGLQFASVIALTVSFGLGLSATIHFLNRLQLEDVRRARSRRRRRARDRAGRPAADLDIRRARLRPGDDGVLRPAIAAAVRLAQRVCDDRSAVRGSVHPAAGRDDARQSHAADGWACAHRRAQQANSERLTPRAR